MISWKLILQFQPSMLKIRSWKEDLWFLLYSPFFRFKLIIFRFLFCYISHKSASLICIKNRGTSCTCLTRNPHFIIQLVKSKCRGEQSFQRSIPALTSFSDLLMFAEHFRGLDELYCHGTECIFPYQILLLNLMMKTQCLNLRCVLTSLIIRLLLLLNFRNHLPSNIFNY